IDMGVEPFLISSSLSGVVAQRLVRRVCRDCQKVKEPTEREKEIFAGAGVLVDKVHYGEGCTSCHQTGYRGRVAIHEVVPIDKHIRELVMESASADRIRNYVKEAGLPFLLEDGLGKVALGLTTTEEVLRVAATE